MELVEIDGPTVYLRLQGACGSCPSSMTTMTMGIRRKLQESIPVSNACAVTSAPLTSSCAPLVYVQPSCWLIEHKERWVTAVKLVVFVSTLAIVIVLEEALHVILLRRSASMDYMTRCTA